MPQNFFIIIFINLYLKNENLSTKKEHRLADAARHAPAQRNQNMPPHQEEAQRFIEDKSLKHAMQYMRTL
ncbi:MAG: hypothetical protein ACTIDY_09890 [Halomonadaceae bacterium]|uniref:Uncharacterized protein n=1 Tax=Halomonas colorata TaxID=2742615 RepID=A0ABR9G065_9GAMM|nr:hypothetical protein [Halomonas colorata]MBE0464291.1 hypothetical protein [Halomonas colorata]